MGVATTYNKDALDTMIHPSFQAVSIVGGHLVFTTQDGAYVDAGDITGALNAYLQDIAGLTPSVNDFLQYLAGHWTNRTPAQVKTALALTESDVSGLTTDLAGKQPLDSDLTTIAALTPTNGDILEYTAGAWANRTPTQVKTTLAITESDVAGLVSDLATLSSAISSLGGTVSGALTDISGLAPTTGDFLEYISGHWTNKTPAQVKTALGITESDVSGLVADLAGKQASSTALTTIAGLTPAANDFLEYIGTAWTNRTPAQVKTTLAITESDVSGLTSDLASINASISSLGGTVSGALTDISGLTPATGDFLEYIAGHWTNKTAAQVKTALAITESDVSSLTTDLAAKQPLNSALTSISGLSPAANDILQYIAGAWVNRTMAQLKTALALTESDVSGLTTDLAAKQALSSTLTAIAALTPGANDFLEYVGGVWTNRTPTQVKSTLAIAESDVSGLTTDLAAKVAKSGDTMTGKLAPAVATLTNSGTTVALDASLGNSFALTLTASTWTLSNPTNSADGQAIRVRIIQDGTGSRTLAYGTNYDFGAAGSPTLSTAASAVDILAFEYVGSLSKWCFLGIAKGF